MKILRRLRNPMIVVVTTVIVIGIAVGIHKVRPPGYTSEAVLVVPSNAAHTGRVHGAASTAYQGPGLEDQAQKLALTFAGLIPSDQSILQAASRRLDRSTSDIQNRLTVVNEANTALVTIGYTGASRAEALLGATTIAETVSNRHPVSAAIPSGALVLIRLPSTTSSAYTLDTLLSVAAVLGIALGLLLVFVLGRANPRMKSPRDAEELLHVPVTAARWLSGKAPALLVQDWHDAATHAGRTIDDSFVTVALVPATDSAAQAAQVLARWLTSSHQMAESDETDEDRGSGPLRRHESRLAVASEQLNMVHVSAFVRGRRDRDLDLGSVASHDLVVLIIAHGTGARQLSATVDTLADVGRAPDAAIFTASASDLPAG